MMGCDEQAHGHTQNSGAASEDVRRVNGFDDREQGIPSDIDSGPAAGRVLPIVQAVDDGDEDFASVDAPVKVFDHDLKGFLVLARFISREYPHRD
jgi:hypothetical protein